MPLTHPLRPSTSTVLAPLGAVLWLASALSGCDAVESITSSTSYPQACLDLAEALEGTWRESEDESSSLFPSKLVFQRTDPTAGILFGFSEPCVWAISTNCDAILVLDSDEELLLTWGASLVNGWLELENWGQAHLYWKESAPPGCPAKITVDHLVHVPIEGAFTMQGQPLLTGVGAYSAMRVHPTTKPGGGTWDGFVVGPESLTALGDSCDLAAFGVTTCTCDGQPCAKTFTVGAKLAGSEPGVADGEPNVFWDAHVFTSDQASLLHQTGNAGPCTTSCRQVYTCGGKVVSEHIVRYTFDRDDANGVTHVSVQKQ